ncbi:hypothetical protein AAFF_G00379070 [Aldrovandia affinis]|uniref:Uncharacterized protein n=1 Tax=Aldrovandia affinis TaxID=143900 RepID=A0AAD7SFP1_9TELE|nr:hypothetical protein AAFF_G00379070 [Aldrovandia affinis]
MSKAGLIEESLTPPPYLWWCRRAGRLWRGPARLRLLSEFCLTLQGGDGTDKNHRHKPTALPEADHRCLCQPSLLLKVNRVQGGGAALLNTVAVTVVRRNAISLEGQGERSPLGMGIARFEEGDLNAVEAIQWQARQTREDSKIRPQGDV